MRRRSTAEAFRRRALTSLLAFALACASFPARVPATVALPEGQTGAVVVGFAPGSSAMVAAAVRNAGARVLRRSASADFLVAAPVGGVTPAEFAVTMGALPGVRYAEPERRVRASFTPSDPRYPEQWNLDRIGAPLAWGVTRGRSSVRIAVVDSGVDLGHLDLAGQLDTGDDYDFVDRDTIAADEFGHGTHVAGVIAARTDNARDIAGVAHGCTILPVRVLDDRGNGADSILAEGIRYAADKRVDVINLSLGTPTHTRVLAEAVQYAISKGIVVVAAAGNKGRAGLDYPAAYPDVIAVAATSDTDVRTAVSQYGETLDLMAPGDNILSLRPVTGPAAGRSTGVMSGTSMAVPHVSAAAALLRSTNPTWTAAVIGHRLMATARDLGDPGRDALYGFGLLRAGLALGAGMSTPEPPSDDDLPGMPVLTSPISDLVDAEVDPVDVYSLSLSEGQRLRARLKGSAGTTTTLSLAGPDSSSLAEATALDSVASTGSPALLDFVVPEGEAGTHYLVVMADEGGGPYTLAWERGYPSSMEIAAPATCAWGGFATIYGVVFGVDSEGLALVRVRLDQRPAGAEGWTVGTDTAVADEDGGFRFRVRPARKTSYRVRFTGGPGQLAVTSRPVTITPKAALTAPATSGQPRRHTPFTVSGTLRPQHPEDERSVRITAELRTQNGTVLSRRSVFAVNQDRDGATRYVARLALPTAGRWRIVASVTADDDHAATTSKPLYVTVP